MGNKHDLCWHLPITEEEKERWAPILRRTWDYIAADAIAASGGKCSRGEVVEIVCDASRPMQDHGRNGEVMTKEEYRVFGQWYGSHSFKKWMKEVFPSSQYVI